MGRLLYPSEASELERSGVADENATVHERHASQQGSRQIADVDTTVPRSFDLITAVRT